MSLSLVTDLTDEPVSLEDQKDHLRLDITADDHYVADCITAARVFVEGQTKRSLMPKTYDYSIDSAWPYKYGSIRIDFPVNPVASVTSITYVDTDGASQTLASNQYTVVGRAHHSYIVPAYGVSFPDVRSVPNAITVRFIVGDSDNIPQELHRAILILAGFYYENRETGAGAPDAVEALISPFRKATF
jgi:uncharacterized phiE125 gp8 family phage protein